MLAYSNGDLEAFQTLYRRHKGRVFGFLLAKIKNRDEAEEIFQTVFAKLHRTREKYRLEIPFLPWIFTISRNCLIDHIRKNETFRKHVTLSDEVVQAYAELDSSQIPIDMTFEELPSLNETQRRALKLRFEEGFSFEEIAEQLQTSLENARQIISRSIRKLRKVMTNKEKDNEIEQE
jgi:RNA polymerase sigma-70 factor (ECF subfamily)